MDALVAILAFLVVLVALVLVHEVGHFAAAKMAGITVQEFGVGFPPRAASVMWRGTRYSLNWIPLGGFVKMLGEDGDIEAKRMRERGLSEGAIEQAMAGAFNRKPILVRIGVLLAGVVMNFLLAAVLFSIASTLPVEVGRGPLTVTEIQAASPAEGNLRVGDVIVSADGQTFEYSADLTAYVREHAGSPVTLGVRRDGQMQDVVVTPRHVTDEERAQGKGAIGFGYEPQSYEQVASPVTSAPQAVARGFGAAVDIAYRIPGGLVDAIGGLLGLNDSAGAAAGPIGIAAETGRQLEAPLVNQLTFIGLLSINLAVLNVLPFPPLDGGRILVIAVEAVRRRKLPAEREALIYLTGFMVLIALVILISIQDVQNLIEG
jgi:regulator of sigma E protease